ncbi:MAG: hypothetical protein QF631_09365 [Arenicellales bacterium]|jgi:hypothetical protein|nr:hypothetical protein [Arenicellales bacterium]MDP7156542.1 hypothetical protein [Arenicellales bacterium]|tara:strand:+ start:422 stop:1033 length:612 start_codon:yes stop_codon:yes gene_type:complete
MSALEAWRAIPQTQEIVDYFRGIFDIIGITIEETGEQLTIAIEESRIRIEEGLPVKPDFIVPLKWENVENMVSHSKDGKIDAHESWRIVSVLFTSLTQATLYNPIMASNIGRKISRVEDLTHVYLIAPGGHEATCHTLAYLKKQWLVIPGLYGKPKRTFRITAEESIEYQRRAFRAIKKNSFNEWWRFSRWYKSWRKTVSVKH